MAVKLRLRRLGRTHLPYYHIVAADARSPRDGKFLEKVGTYNPLLRYDNVTLNHEAALKWLQNGAQPTDTVRSILSREGVLLKRHLRAKGMSDDEIQRTYEEWRRKRDAKVEDAKVAAERQKREAAEAALKHEREVNQQRSARIANKGQAPAKSEASEDAE